MLSHKCRSGRMEDILHFSLASRHPRRHIWVLFPLFSSPPAYSSDGWRWKLCTGKKQRKDQGKVRVLGHGCWTRRASPSFILSVSSFSVKHGKCRQLLVALSSPGKSWAQHSVAFFVIVSSWNYSHLVGEMTRWNPALLGLGRKLHLGWMLDFFLDDKQSSFAWS